MVATLTGIFGVEHLTLAEDVVQEALVSALKTWPFYGVPQNPAAWIMRASRNLALDVVRREKVFRSKEPEIIRIMDRAEPEVVLGEREIGDDRLRMMFVCCHPVLAMEAQVALTLKVLAGFSVTEISRAFLSTEATIAKRLTRAKQKIREAGVPFEMPDAAELAPRLDGVLHSLYLLFNEGYKASSGEKLVREEVCSEAIRLTGLLAEHPACNQPRVHALLALMLLNAARFPARVDVEGNLLLLKEQDRGQWDRAMIGRGMHHLALAAEGEEITEYHVQAGIAACHGSAPDYESTDWKRILSLYDCLAHFDGSPVVALNRAVVIGNIEGPQAGLEAVAAIPERSKLEGYYLLHAVMGEFESRRENWEAAARHYGEAIKLVEMKPESDFLRKRLSACAGKSAS